MVVAIRPSVEKPRTPAIALPTPKFSIRRGRRRGATRFLKRRSHYRNLHVKFNMSEKVKRYAAGRDRCPVLPFPVADHVAWSVAGSTSPRDRLPDGEAESGEPGHEHRVDSRRDVCAPGLDRKTTMIGAEP